MTTRDQYVAGLKSQIDQWNAEIARWETRAQATKKALKSNVRAQLKTLNAQRELARYNLTLLEGASSAAWSDVRAGADEVFERMQMAMKEARSHFEKARPAP